MTELPHVVERATFLLWIAHNLERIGDRAINICERAIYVVTGEIREHSER
ncbi:MAG: PhoU domain-containing protein [Anaerolineae bacterium]|nr:PhoU domain-containing protein [Anaerolineae bacterium]